MITIKKYPNRRLYNTATSTYINLEGIQNLILEGETIEIIDSKTNTNVTSATLLLHALDADVIEALVPSIWMQQLMRMSSNETRLAAIQSLEDSEESSESETQEEKTLPKVATVQPVDMIVSILEDDSESSDSDSEVTIVRAGEPPTEPVVPSIDSATPIEVQVSMDAWGVSGETEDSEIPSFWSESSFDDLGLNVADKPVGESSDDGLFDQPETVVVRHPDSVDSVSLQPQSEPIQRPEIDDINSQLEVFKDEVVDSSQESSSSNDEQISTDYASSSSAVDQKHKSFESRESLENTDSVPTSSERPSINSVPESLESVSSNQTSIAAGSPSKSEKMKARLAAMKAKLKR